jgi:hypothetical protein
MSHFIYNYTECHYAECRHAQCRYAECHGAFKITDIEKNWTLKCLLLLKTMKFCSIPERVYKSTLILLIFNIKMPSLKISISIKILVIPYFKLRLSSSPSFSPSLSLSLSLSISISHYLSLKN